MALSDVDRIHNEFTTLLRFLSDRGEPSLQNAADDSFKKVLILSAASYFEHEMVSIVADFVDEVASSNALIRGLVHCKAIDRQYHTWFSWKENNANQFFGMFGSEFKSHMISIVRASPEVNGSIKAFLEMGLERNRLAHQNFAAFSMEKTAEEIFTLYKTALPFIDTLRKELRTCSSKLKNASEDAKLKTAND